MNSLKFASQTFDYGTQEHHSVFEERCSLPDVLDFLFLKEQGFPKFPGTVMIPQDTRNC
jgi:hypothetical protein